MKGMIRSIYYWMFNMEKMFLVMVVTIIGVMGFQVLLNDRNPQMMQDMLRTDLPMLGSLFVLTVSMGASTYYIPQSLSNGGTRKEVYIGMQIGFHVILLQIFLLEMAAKWLLPGEILPMPYVRVCITLYLLILGAGDILCMCCLRFGGKTGMIIYMVLVMLFSGTLGALAALDNIDFIRGLMIKAGSVRALAAVSVFDIAAMIVCYLPFRKYEVRV